MYPSLINIFTHFIMKKTTILKYILAVLLANLHFQTLFAQEKQPRIFYSVYVGANLSQFKPLELSKSPIFGNIYHWSGAYNFGANIDFALSNIFYVESGLNFISKRSNAATKVVAEQNITSYKIPVTTYTKTHFAKSNYNSFAFQIPLSLHINIYQKDGFKANVFGGILWENMIYSKNHTLFTNNWTPKVPPTDVLAEVQNIFSDATYELKNDPTFRKSNVGMLAGIGGSINKLGIDIGVNSPDRVIGSVQYRIPSVYCNLRYQIN
jgi:hypothetical protein